MAEQALLDRLELADPVIAPRHGLHQGAGVADVAADQRRQRLRARDERRHALLAVRGVVRQRLEVALHRRVRLLAPLLHERLVAAAPAQLAHELGQRRLARAERALEPVEHAAQLVVAGLVELEPAGEDGAHRGAGRVGALLREEQAEGRLFQGGRALEPADPVVRERALERRHEPLGEALGGRVERAQEGVQVLLRAAQHLLGVARGVRAAERPDVGVDLEHPVLAVGVGRRGEHVDARHVVAEHQPLEPLQLAGVRLGGLERDALALLPRGVVERLDLEQRPPGGDVDVAADEHLAHAAVDGRGQRGLHLHALGDGHDVAGLDLVTR